MVRRSAADRANSVQEARLRARRRADRGEVAHNQLISPLPIMKFLVVCLVAHASEISSMGDCRKCQTSTATPAEPGELLGY
jgi:hypothetical protein